MQVHPVGAEGAAEAGWCHTDLRWDNVIQYGGDYVVIDLEHCLKLGTVVAAASGPASRLARRPETQEGGRYTAKSDLHLVAKLMDEAMDLLDESGQDLQRKLLGKSLALDEALAHAWLR